MKLTARITGRWDTRADQAKKLGAKRLLEWNDIVKIYESNDTENIKILEQDMKDSYLIIPAPDILLSEDNPIIKRIAGDRPISVWNIKKTNKYVRLYFYGDRFVVSGYYWFVGGDGYSHGVQSVSESKDLTKSERTELKELRKENKQLKASWKRYGECQSERLRKVMGVIKENGKEFRQICGQWNNLCPSCQSKQKSEYETTCGKRVHFVGIGVCGQPVVQIKVGEGTDKTHDAWKLARVEGTTCISLGKDKHIWQLNKRLNEPQELTSKSQGQGVVETTQSTPLSEDGRNLSSNSLTAEEIHKMYEDRLGFPNTIDDEKFIPLSKHNEEIERIKKIDQCSIDARDNIIKKLHSRKSKER